MVQNINNDLEKILNKFIKKHIMINQDGFLKIQFSIHELKYFVKSEVLNIADEKSNNYLSINLNQIYKIENNEKELKLYLDNDTILALNIKKID